MRKITTLLLLFCMVSGIALAQTTVVTDLSQLRNDKKYFIESARCFLMYSTSVSSKLCASNGTSVGTVEKDYTDVNQQFQIINEDGHYYLYSVGKSMWVNKTGAFTSSLADALTLENVGGTYQWKLCIGGNGLNSQESGQMAEGIVVNDWTTTDPGNCYKITEIDPVFDEVLVSSVGDLSNDKVYTITCKFDGRGFLYSPEEGKNYLDFAGTTESYSWGGPWGQYKNVTYNPLDIQQQFAIVSYNSKYYLYSISRKMFCADDKTGDDNGRNTLTSTPEDPIIINVADDGSFNFKFESTGRYITSRPSWAGTGTSLLTVKVDVVSEENSFSITDVTEYAEYNGNLTLPIAVKLAEISEDDVLLSGLEGYIGTFSAPYATAIPDGVTAYYAGTEETDHVKLTQIETDVVPANEGVILVGSSNEEVSSIEVAMLPTTSEETINGNLFSNSATDTVTMENGDYILARGDQGIGFYPAEPNSTLGQYKAYFRSADIGTNALRLVVNETTGVETLVPATDVNAPIYDLSGRRVLNTIKGGIYIQNGKKFIVK